MATKIKVSKLLQEMRGFADIANRRPPPRTPGLFLMQMRSHALRTPQSRPKRTISIDVQGCADIPASVKIRHLKTRPIHAVASPAS